MMFRKKIKVLVWGAGQTDSGNQLQEPLGGSGSAGRGRGACGDPGRGMDKGLWGPGVGVRRPGLLVGSTVNWQGDAGPF